MSVASAPITSCHPRNEKTGGQQEPEMQVTNREIRTTRIPRVYPLAQAATGTHQDAGEDERSDRVVDSRVLHDVTHSPVEGVH